MAFGQLLGALGLSIALLSGCARGALVQTAERDPTCEDECILGGREDLNVCLQECGGGDFTAQLGCQVDDPRAACNAYPYTVAEEDSGSSFVSALFDIVGGVLDAVGSDEDTEEYDEYADEPSEPPPDGPAVGPEPEERPEAPSRPAKSKQRTPAEPAKSKSRAPAKPGRG